MANRNEKRHGVKVRMRQLADRAIALNESVPGRMVLSPEQNTIPEKDCEIVSQISGTAIVEIEEHRLPGMGSLQRDVGVVAVAVAVAACPGKSVPFRHAGGQSRRQIDQPVANGTLRSSSDNT